MCVLYTQDGSIVITMCNVPFGEPGLDVKLCSRATVGRRAVLTVTAWQCLSKYRHVG